MGANTAKFNLQNRVLAIGENDRGDVEILSRLSPQRLQRVHAATIGLQINHGPVGASYRCTGGCRHAVADGAAGEHQPVMRRTGAGGNCTAATTGTTLVNHDGVVRKVMRQRNANCLRC